jgi:hypothetical protein
MSDCICGCHPALEKCGECCFKHKLFEAKKENAALYERIGILGECLHLQSENLNQLHNLKNLIDPIREALRDVFERLDDLERLGTDINLRKIHNATEILIENFNNRLSNLEKEHCTFAKQTSELMLDNEERIDGLEAEINIVRALGSRAFHPKKPHKCPVCDGNCMRLNPLSEIPINVDCTVCEGKGVVWE